MIAKKRKKKWLFPPRKRLERCAVLEENALLEVPVRVIGERTLEFLGRFGPSQILTMTVPGAHFSGGDYVIGVIN